MPDQKMTSQILLAALRRKYPDNAILREVTMEDIREKARSDQWYAQNPRYRKYPPLPPGTPLLDLPEGYHPKNAVLVRRIDALMYEGNIRTAIEIKVSRSDFFRDTEDKRAAWKSCCHRFIYLTPKGLVKPEEVPADCGLWEYESGSIVSVKRAKVQKNPEPMPESMIKYFVWRAFIAEQKLANRRF